MLGFISIGLKNNGKKSKRKIPLQCYMITCYKSNNCIAGFIHKSQNSMKKAYEAGKFLWYRISGDCLMFPRYADNGT